MAGLEQVQRGGCPAIAIAAWPLLSALVALMSIGRGDAEPLEREETVELARDRKQGPTPRYLLGHPLVAEHWEEGAAGLGVELPIGQSL